MKGLIVAMLAGLVACTIGVPSVVRFAVDKEHQEKKDVQMLGFKFGNCTPTSKETMVVKSISLLPDPIVFPGPLNISFSVEFKDDVDSPLKAIVLLEKQVGSTWIKIPCIGNIGSCTYDDLCSLLSGISSCPDPFISAGVPCQCPFKKGTYTLPAADFDVEVAIFPPGNYRGQANLSMNDKVVGCYNLTATFG